MRFLPIYSKKKVKNVCNFFMLIRVTDLNPADAFLPGPQSGKVDLIEGLVGQMQVDPLRRDGELKRHCLVSLCHDYRQKQHSLSSKKKKKTKLDH